MFLNVTYHTWNRIQKKKSGTISEDWLRKNDKKWSHCCLHDCHLQPCCLYSVLEIRQRWAFRKACALLTVVYLFSSLLVHQFTKPNSRTGSFHRLRLNTISRTLYSGWCLSTSTTTGADYWFLSLQPSYVLHENQEVNCHVQIFIQFISWLAC